MEFQITEEDERTSSVHSLEKDFTSDETGVAKIKIGGEENKEVYKQVITLGTPVDSPAIAKKDITDAKDEVEAEELKDSLEQVVLDEKENPEAGRKISKGLDDGIEVNKER